jgi:hypothetical protein
VSDAGLAPEPEPGADATRGSALRSCWANPRLRRTLAAYLLFNVAEWANWIALLVWAYDRDGVRGASVIALCQLVPAALVAPVAATRLARLPAPRALQLGYAAQALTGLFLAAALLAGGSFGLVAALAALSSSAVTLTRPVHNALLPEISETTGELTAGNAGSGSVEAAATLLGPLSSGALVALWAPGGVVLVMAVASLVSAVLAANLGPRATRVRGSASDSAGVSPLRAVLRDPAARLLSAMVAAEYVLVGMMDILLVVLALDLLDMAASGPGLLSSAIGVGGLVGASLTVVLIGARRLAPYLVLGAVVAGLPFAFAGVSGSVGLAMALIALCGAGKLFFDVASRTFVQRLLPDRLLTAVFGLQESTMMAGLAVGSLAAPLLVSGPGPTTAFVVAGLFLPVVALAGWWTLRRLDASTTVPEDTLALLRSVPMLGVLAPRVVERLAVFAGHQVVPDGVAVVSEGETGDLFYVVESGQVVVSRGSDRIRTLGPGGWFGELALLRADEMRTATVRADGPVELVTVDRQTFLTALAGVSTSRTIADEHARDHYR